LQGIVQMWQKAATGGYPPVGIPNSCMYVLRASVRTAPHVWKRCDRVHQAMYQYGLALERGVAHTAGGRAKALADAFK